jgi:hypothetical protein
MASYFPVFHFQSIFLNSFVRFCISFTDFPKWLCRSNRIRSSWGRLIVSHSVYWEWSTVTCTLIAEISLKITIIKQPTVKRPTQHIKGKYRIGWFLLLKLNILEFIHIKLSLFLTMVLDFVISLHTLFFPEVHLV